MKTKQIILLWSLAFLTWSCQLNSKANLSSYDNNSVKSSSGTLVNIDSQSTQELNPNIKMNQNRNRNQYWKNIDWKTHAS